MTIPMIFGISADLPASWLYHAKRLCAGKQFDQVWIELVHSDPGDEVLEWLVSIAPVRLALLPESLSYDREDYLLYPELFKRRLEVEERLRYMTHAVTVDEKDAEDLNRRGIVKALWRPETVPAWCIAEQPNSMPRDKAVFYGTLYGPRKRWLMHPALTDLFEVRPSAEAGTNIPHAFTTVGSAALKALNRGLVPDKQFLDAYLDCLRGIRRSAFANWINLASRSPLVVNLPSTTKAQSGRVVEAMAAGCPVMTWELPDRPRANALFRDGEEWLLFPRDNPDALADKIRYLARNPEAAREMAANALHVVKKCHTVEVRVGQILNWIESGREPDYRYGQTFATRPLSPVPSQEELDTTLRHFFDLSGYHGYQPRCYTENPSAFHHKNAEQDMMLEKLSTLFEQKEISAARDLMEKSWPHIPELASPLAQLYFVTGDLDKAEEFLLQRLSYEPYNAETYIKLAKLAAMAGNPAISASYVEMALALGPPAGEALHLLEEHRRLKGGK